MASDSSIRLTFDILEDIVANNNIDGLNKYYYIDLTTLYGGYLNQLGYLNELLDDNYKLKIFQFMVEEVFVLDLDIYMNRIDMSVFETNTYLVESLREFFTDNLKLDEKYINDIINRSIDFSSSIYEYIFDDVPNGEWIAPFRWGTYCGEKLKLYVTTNNNDFKFVT